MKWTYVIGAFMVFSLATACQSGALKLANAGNDEAQYRLMSDIAYGEEDWQKLDLYQPKDARGKSPVVLFLYGGGWSGGKKEDYQFIANRLVREGYSVIIPDYRKYPEAKYPEFQWDAAKASRWLANNASEYNLDKDALFIMGHSAGAHMGGMLIADKSYLGVEGLQPSMFAGFIGISGPYHFTPGIEKYETIFGPPENYPKMQMTHFIDGSEPPMLLQHGLWDAIVGKVNIERLEPALGEHNNTYEVKYYPQATHFSIIGAYSDTLPLHASVVEDALAFMRKYQ